MFLTETSLSLSPTEWLWEIVSRHLPRDGVMSVMLVYVICRRNRRGLLLAIAKIPEVLVDAIDKWIGNFGREMPRAGSTGSGSRSYFLDCRTTARGQYQIKCLALDVIWLAIAEYCETNRIVAGAAINVLSGRRRRLREEIRQLGCFRRQNPIGKS